MGRKTRKLSRDDQAVWERVTEHLTPLRRAPAIEDPRPAKWRPAPPPKARSAAAPEFDITPSVRSADRPQTRIDLVPDPMDSLATAAPRIDSKINQRLKRGKLAPESRIDLHGMTADRAHAALRAFIPRAHDRGQRLVLVITGKGRSAPGDELALPARRGVLRNAVPKWLAEPPLSAMVLQIAPAHQRHGGGGAYYVYLRRR